MHHVYAMYEVVSCYFGLLALLKVTQVWIVMIQRMRYHVSCSVGVRGPHTQSHTGHLEAESVAESVAESESTFPAASGKQCCSFEFTDTLRFRLAELSSEPHPGITPVHMTKLTNDETLCNSDSEGDNHYATKWQCTEGPETTGRNGLPEVGLLDYPVMS
jgi:hypothetical protein